MKHFYTLLLAAVVGVLSCQGANLTFYYNGDTPIENGSTVTVNCLSAEDMGGFYYVALDPKVFVETTSFAKVSVTAACTSGETIQMCAGGNCVNAESVTKEFSLNPGSKFALDIEYAPGVIMDLAELTPVTIELSALVSGTPAFACTLILNPVDPAGVADVEADSSAAPVEYFDLLGRRVATPAEGRLLLRRQGTMVEKVRF